VVGVGVGVAVAVAVEAREAPSCHRGEPRLLS
jgi:hypothetical protein